MAKKFIGHLPDNDPLRGYLQYDIQPQISGASDRDIFGARQLGLKTIFFKPNQGEHEKDGVKPDYIIYHFSELPEAIRFLEDH